MLKLSLPRLPKKLQKQWRKKQPLRKWLGNVQNIFQGKKIKIKRRLGKKIKIGLALGAILLILGSIYLMRDLPSPRNLTKSENYAVSTQIFDRSGKLLYEIYADENRIPIQLDEIPDYVWQATIAIEDQNFYRHFGFDVIGILRAVRTNLRGERLEGGSTITQQLVKNALLTRERSVQRKIKELMLSILTEVLYTKDQILEMYLNYISYGGTSVGIEAAARSYFDKSAKDLTPAEAAMLAGLPQAPSRYSPFASDSSLAKNRQAEVLRRMVEDKYITQEQADKAKTQTLQFALNQQDIQAPHFVFYIRDLLYQQYGAEKVEKGGLRVTTSLDLDIQNMAQASVSAEVADLARMRVSNGAALVLKPNTGEILAMVGSANYFDPSIGGQVNVTLAERQPGSSIKPIMYATTFQAKTLNPGTILVDTPVCFSVPNQQPYCPKNYDGSFRGAVTVRQALGNSLNIPAVKAIYTIGVEAFINQARAMGINTWQDPSQYGLSLALGGGEVRMIDLATAFGVLANQGVRVDPLPILKVEDYTGEILFEAHPEKRVEDLTYLSDYSNDLSSGELRRVMDRAPAYLVSHILQDNSARSWAFGSRSELVIPNQVVSAKTGTTNNLKDNWTLGFTPEILVAAWVGNNDGTPMNPYLVSGVTGAAPIFNDIMSELLKNREPVWQEKPVDVKSAQVCASGMPPQPDDDCQPRDQELFWTESKPSQSKVAKTNVWIDPRTGLPPAEGEQIDGLVLEERMIYEDPTGKAYCSDCNRAVDEQGKTIYEQQKVEYRFLPQNEEDI